MSLLGDSWEDPKTMATLQLAAGLLGGGNFGQALGRGLGGYQQSLSNAQEAAFMKEQMDWKRQQIQDAKDQQAEKKRVEGVVRQALIGLTPAQAIGMDASGPTPQKAALIGQRPALDANALIAQGVPVERVKELFDAQNLGRQKVARTVKGIGPDGKEYEYQVDEFGQRVGDGLAQYRAPIEMDTGGRKSLLDPYNFKEKFGVNKTMTPGEQASNAVARGNLAVAQQRLSFDLQGGAEGGGVAQAGLIKRFGKAPIGYRWKEDGSMEYVPGGPADQKAQLQKSGEGTVASVVADLRDKYNILDSENAVVSQGNRVGTNIGAWIGNTGAGQTLSGMLGTKAQSARDSIAMTRPLLLQAIMKATGMSAKQMDSNAELKMYLATATDPKLGLQANMEALDRIERLYGGGANAGSTSATASPVANKAVKRTGTYNGRKVIEYTDGTVDYGN